MFNKFTTLREGLQAAEINIQLLQSAEDMLDYLKISKRLQHDVVQPCIRARLHQDLASVSGLAAMITLSGDPRQISYWNIALVERMLRLSYAEARPNSQVISIGPRTSRRYALDIRVQHGDEKSSAERVEYDAVVYAAPLSYRDLDTSGLALSTSQPSVAWDALHVTHLMTTSQLTPNRSVLPFDVAISDDKNSITFSSDVITSSANLSMNILSMRPRAEFNFGGPCHWDDECDDYDRENLYQIYSRHRLSDDDLAGILMPPNASGPRHLKDHELSWLHRQQWSAGVPVRDKDKPLPVDVIELAPEFFYLNAAEHVVSSLEMSCRMGAMVARKLFYEHRGM